MKVLGELKYLGVKEKKRKEEKVRESERKEEKESVSVSFLPLLLFGEEKEMDWELGTETKGVCAV